MSETKDLSGDEIEVCEGCGKATKQKFSGDEGWSFCTGGCGCVEGHTKMIPVEEYEAEHA